LVQPADVPAVIRIIWPLRPTVADPRRYAEVAAAAMPAAGQRVHRAGTAQGGTEGMTDLTIMTTA
jgi:hypothetical protein